MKEKLLSLLMLISTSVTFSQVQLNPETEILTVSENICTYYEMPPSQRTTVFRSEILQEKMNNDTPCSDFIVSYNGFTAEAQQAFEFAMSIWEHSIESTVPIRIEASFQEMQEGALGTANPSGFVALGGIGIPANTIFPLALAEKMVGYEITQGGETTSIDIISIFNSTSSFYFGTDGNPGADQIDFVSVVLHEIGHGLGLAGLANTTVTEGAIRYAGVYASIWDQFIVNGSDIPLLSYPDPSVELLEQLTGDDLFCNGSEAIFQNYNLNPKIYAPETFQQGTSYSHWDESSFPPGDPNSLMTPGIGPGEAIHDPGLVTLGFMQDLGWAICGSLLDVYEASLQSFNISPNPFTSEIKIILSAPYNTSHQISFFDINGKQLYHNKTNDINGEIKISDLDDLENAIYFVKIRSEETGRELSKRIIKQ